MYEVEEVTSLFGESYDYPIPDEEDECGEDDVSESELEDGEREGGYRLYSDSYILPQHRLDDAQRVENACEENEDSSSLHEISHSVETVTYVEDGAVPTSGLPLSFGHFSVEINQEYSETSSSEINQEGSETSFLVINQEDSETPSSEISRGNSETSSSEINQDNSETSSSEINQEDSESSSSEITQDNCETSSLEINPNDSGASSSEINQEDSKTSSSEINQDNSETSSLEINQEYSETSSSEINQEGSETSFLVINQEDSETPPSEINRGNSEPSSLEINQDNSETSSSEINQEDSETSSSEINQDNSEISSLEINQEDSETASSEINQEDSETSSSEINQDNSENSSLVINQEDSETSSPEINQEDNETSSLEINQEDSRTSSSEINQEDSGTSSLEINQECSETSSSVINQEGSETSSSEINQEDSETSSLEINQEDSETSSSEINQENSETSSSEINQDNSETSSLEINQEKCETSSLEFNQEDSETSSSEISQDDSHISSLEINQDDCHTSTCTSYFEINQDNSQTSSLEISQDDSCTSSVEKGSLASLSEISQHNSRISINKNEGHTSSLEINHDDSHTLSTTSVESIQKNSHTPHVKTDHGHGARYDTSGQSTQDGACTSSCMAPQGNCHTTCPETVNQSRKLNHVGNCTQLFFNLLQKTVMTNLSRLPKATLIPRLLRQLRVTGLTYYLWMLSFIMTVISQISRVAVFIPHDCHNPSLQDGSVEFEDNQGDCCTECGNSKYDNNYCTPLIKFTQTGIPTLSVTSEEGNIQSPSAESTQNDCFTSSLKNDSTTCCVKSELEESCTLFLEVVEHNNHHPSFQSTQDCTLFVAAQDDRCTPSVEVVQDVNKGDHHSTPDESKCANKQSVVATQCERPVESMVARRHNPSADAIGTEICCHDLSPGAIQGRTPPLQDGSQSSTLNYKVCTPSVTLEKNGRHTPSSDVSTCGNSPFVNPVLDSMNTHSVTVAQDWTHIESKIFDSTFGVANGHTACTCMETIEATHHTTSVVVTRTQSVYAAHGGSHTPSMKTSEDTCAVESNHYHHLNPTSHGTSVEQDNTTTLSEQDNSPTSPLCDSHVPVSESKDDSSLTQSLCKWDYNQSVKATQGDGHTPLVEVKVEGSQNTSVDAIDDAKNCIMEVTCICRHDLHSEASDSLTYCSSLEEESHISCKECNTSVKFREKDSQTPSLEAGNGKNLCLDTNEITPFVNLKVNTKHVLSLSTAHDETPSMSKQDDPCVEVTYADSPNTFMDTVQVGNHTPFVEVSHTQCAAHGSSQTSITQDECHSPAVEHKQYNCHTPSLCDSSIQNIPPHATPTCGTHTTPIEFHWDNSHTPPGCDTHNPAIDSHQENSCTPPGSDTHTQTLEFNQDNSCTPPGCNTPIQAINQEKSHPAPGYGTPTQAINQEKSHPVPGYGTPTQAINQEKSHTPPDHDTSTQAIKSHQEKSCTPSGCGNHTQAIEFNQVNSCTPPDSGTHISAIESHRRKHHTPANESCHENSCKLPGCGNYTAANESHQGKRCIPHGYQDNTHMPFGCGIHTPAIAFNQENSCTPLGCGTYTPANESHHKNCCNPPGYSTHIPAIESHKDNNQTPAIEGYTHTPPGCGIHNPAIESHQENSHTTLGCGTHNPANQPHHDCIYTPLGCDSNGPTVLSNYENPHVPSVCESIPSTVSEHDNSCASPVCESHVPVCECKEHNPPGYDSLTPTVISKQHNSHIVAVNSKLENDSTQLAFDSRIPVVGHELGHDSSSVDESHTPIVESEYNGYALTVEVAPCSRYTSPLNIDQNDSLALCVEVNHTSQLHSGIHTVPMKINQDECHSQGVEPEPVNCHTQQVFDICTTVCDSHTSAIEFEHNNCRTIALWGSGIPTVESEQGNNCTPCFDADEEDSDTTEIDSWSVVANQVVNHRSCSKIDNICTPSAEVNAPSDKAIQCDIQLPSLEVVQGDSRPVDFKKDDTPSALALLGDSSVVAPTCVKSTQGDSHIPPFRWNNPSLMTCVPPDTSLLTHLESDLVPPDRDATTRIAISKLFLIVWFLYFLFFRAMIQCLMWLGKPIRNLWMYLSNPSLIRRKSDVPPNNVDRGHLDKKECVLVNNQETWMNEPGPDDMTCTQTGLKGDGLKLLVNEDISCTQKDRTTTQLQVSGQKYIDQHLSVHTTRPTKCENQDEVRSTGAVFGREVTESTPSKIPTPIQEACMEQEQPTTLPHCTHGCFLPSLQGKLQLATMDKFRRQLVTGKGTNDAEVQCMCCKTRSEEHKNCLECLMCDRQVNYTVSPRERETIMLQKKASKESDYTQCQTGPNQYNCVYQQSPGITTNSSEATRKKNKEMHGRHVLSQATMTLSAIKDSFMESGLTADTDANSLCQSTPDRLFIHNVCLYDNSQPYSPGILHPLHPFKMLMESEVPSELCEYLLLVPQQSNQMPSLPMAEDPYLPLSQHYRIPMVFAECNSVIHNDDDVMADQDGFFVTPVEEQ